MTSLAYTETPVQEILDPVLQSAAVRLFVKREDQNHVFVSGNKWWKLKYNLEEAALNGFTRLLTFGGAFSNHIYATAAAAAATGFASAGVIRGEEVLPLNPTLSFAREQGMVLHFISRSEYRKKEQFFSSLPRERREGTYLIPEGGTNLMAVKGCEEFGKTLLALEFDEVFLPVGTGGTISGMICAFSGMRRITGIPVLRNSGFLNDEIHNLVLRYSGKSFSNWRLLEQYHHGGYARTSPTLLWFMNEMENKHQLPLDHVYTGKLLWAVFEEVKKGTFSPGTKLLVIHTGGLQGRNERRITKL